MSLPLERHLQRAKDLMDARYAEALDIGGLAATAGLSPAYFSRLFKQTYGESPHGYLLTRRLERAADLLRNTDRSVADVCMLVGLTSIGSFTTSFKRMFGRTPTAYRAAFPPAAAWVTVPACMVRAYGRPKHRTFREDASAAGSLASQPPTDTDEEND